jgi:uncharacterized membrane protein YedE/YeeE
MRRQGTIAGLMLFAGALFGAGLAVSGMTQPAKVVGFLDVLGAWDPSLAFVMLGAVAVYLAAYRGLAVKMPRPLYAPRFSLPALTAIDAPLLGGAAIFGVGWGLSGYCPGPALVALGADASAALWFVPAMLVGMLLHRAVRPGFDP